MDPVRHPVRHHVGCPIRCPANRDFGFCSTLHSGKLRDFDGLDQNFLWQTKAPRFDWRLSLSISLNLSLSLSLYPLNLSVSLSLSIPLSLSLSLSLCLASLLPLVFSWCFFPLGLASNDVCQDTCGATFTFTGLCRWYLFNGCNPVCLRLRLPDDGKSLKECVCAMQFPGGSNRATSLVG